MRMFVTVALAVALQGAQSQLITGRVLSADSGAPVANVRILVPNPENQPPTVSMTDRDGRFSVSATTIPVVLTCMKPGYALRALSVAKVGRIRHARDGTPSSRFG